MSKYWGKMVKKRPTLKGKQESGKRRSGVSKRPKKMRLPEHLDCRCLSEIQLGRIVSMLVK